MGQPLGRLSRVPPRGPIWFRRMDLNDDGFVSPREFLGTHEEFRRIEVKVAGVPDASKYRVRHRAGYYTVKSEF